MLPARHRPLSILVAGVITLSLLLMRGAPVLAAPPVLPMPGEKFLTPAERATVRAAMPPGEARAIGRFFDGSGPELLVGYSSAEYTVVENDDGSVSLHQLGPRNADGDAAISLPDRMVAASDYQYVAGTDLYISMTVTRTTTKSPFKWQAMIYSQWNGDAGANCCNDSRDSMSVAWSGSPAYTRSSWSSRYETGCATTSMDVRRDDSKSNGASFSFMEWQGGMSLCRAYWALIYVNFQETTWRNEAGTVSYTYHHTYSNASYSVSISSSPSITITPSTSVWPANVGVGYTY